MFSSISVDAKQIGLAARRRYPTTQRRMIDIPQYGILRFAKHKGAPAGALEAHHERTKERYASNPDIDTSRSKYNFHTVRPAGRYRQEIDSRIAAAGCRTRKDSTRFVDTLITASPEFFTGRETEDVAAYFNRASEFLCKRVGQQNIISAVVHMDERTPHLHLTFVPLTEDGRLSAKDILGNRANLSKWQDEFHAHMAAAYPILERGEPSRETGRRHIPMRVFKQAVHLEEQAKQVEALLADKSLLGATQRREEALAILTKLWPQMAGFESEVKKYKGTIEHLQREKSALVNEVVEYHRNYDAIDIKMAELEGRLHYLERFRAAVPEDARREAEAAMKRGRGPKERTR